MSEYSVRGLSKLSGVTSRTLRYYDEIGLLKPCGVTDGGYRMYGRNEVERLQQILFYKALGMDLKGIRDILDKTGYNPKEALKGHLVQLKEKKERLELIISNVEKTLLTLEGEIEMSDQERFEGLKAEMIGINERKYGDEIREKYGDEAVNESNERLMNMSQEDFNRANELSIEINKMLKFALITEDPSGEDAQEACRLHQEWLSYYNPHYSKEYHKGLGRLYVEDSRFGQYYDQLGEGCAEFFCKAIEIYCDGKAE